jgi:hypothetical protein
MINQMIYHRIFNQKRKKFVGLMLKRMLLIYIKKLVEIYILINTPFVHFLFALLVGFVVGQTEQDWQRMSDDYDPSQKLNQYKYI